MIHVLQFDEAGSFSAIYDDDLLDVFAALGEVSSRRVSHVEPCDGGWSADMAPVGGPVLGPFATRREALDAERVWLHEHFAGLEVA